MNILLVSHELSLTGAPKVLLWLAKYLLKNHHCVDLWSVTNGSLEAEFKSLGIDVLYVKNDRNYIEKTFVKVVRKYDLILCNTVVTYKFVDVLQRFRIPVIWYLHESGFLNNAVLLNYDLKNVLENFYNIYTVSDYAKDVILKYNKQVHVIPNAVEDSFKNYTPLSSKIRFGYIGTISVLKGCDILISAFLKLSKTYPNIELLLAGNYESDFAQELLKQTQECTNIKWFGEVKQESKEKFFDSIDILCAPSVFDSCSLSVLEAAMKGKAIITTRTNGAKYVVHDGENGFVISPKNIVELEKSMETMVQTSNILEQRQKVSRSLYLKFASIQRQEEAIDKMLSENLNNYPIIKRRKFIYKEKTPTHKIYHIGKLKIKVKRRRKAG